MARNLIHSTEEYAMSSALSHFLPSKENQQTVSAYRKYLPARRIRSMAVKCGTVRRKGGKFRPEALLFSSLNEVSCARRLTLHGIFASYNLSVPASRTIEEKPLHDRFRSDGWLKLVMETAGYISGRILPVLESRDGRQLIDTVRKAGICIDDVLCEDGTYFHVSGALADIYPGTRSAAKEKPVPGCMESDGSQSMEKAPNAQIGIMTTYSYRKGACINAEVTAGTDSETASVNTRLPGVLHLMDAGYMNLQLFREIEAAGSFFITPGRVNLAGKIVRISIDGKDYTQQFGGLKPSSPELRCFKSRSTADMEVKLDNGPAFRVIRYYCKRKSGYVYLITNIGAGRLKARGIVLLARARWRIETFFKEWKSGSNLRGVNSRDPNIVLAITITSMIADMLKKLIGTVFEVRNAEKGVRVSTYRIAVYCDAWFKKILWSLLSGDLSPIHELIDGMMKHPADWSKCRQSRKKQIQCRTVNSLCAGILEARTNQGFTESEQVA